MNLDEPIKLIERCFIAVERLHSCDILHGDVSQNNVLVQKDEVVRLIDLGQAKPLYRVGAQSLSEPGGTAGSQDPTVLSGKDSLGGLGRYPGYGGRGLPNIGR